MESGQCRKKYVKIECRKIREGGGKHHRIKIWQDLINAKHAEKNQKHNKPSSRVVTLKLPSVQVSPMELMEHKVNLYVVNGFRPENDACGFETMHDLSLLLGEILQPCGLPSLKMVALKF